MSVAETIVGKAISFGLHLHKRNQNWKRFDRIVSTYRLEMCESEEELMTKFNGMDSGDRIFFLKMMPDFFEYVEHARRYPGVPYHRDPRVYDCFDSE